MSAWFDCADADQRTEGLAAAVTAVLAGELVVLPTDTVYGLGADAFSPAAVNRLLAAKGRGRDMPPPVLVGTVRAAAALVEDLGQDGQQLIDEFWPGGLTIVCRAARTLSWDLGDTKGTVAIRMPDQEHCPGPAARDRTDGGEQRQHDRLSGRDHGRRGPRAARRVGRGLPGWRSLRKRRGLDDRGPDRLAAPAAAPRRDLGGAAPRGRRSRASEPTPTWPEASDLLWARGRQPWQLAGCSRVAVDAL